MPLYRQSEIYARQGVAIERSTLAGWVPGIAIAAHAAAGRTEQAREIDRQFPADGSIAEAIREYWFGEIDRMFEALHRLVDERSYYVFTFTNWAVYRPLYPDPRFQSLLRKLNLPPR